MTTIGPTQGDRIRDLFRNAEEDVAIIAPFIKIGALTSLLEVVPPATHLRCVTRWLPREVAAGVSDPEILDVLEQRGNFNLTLVDNLHAKLYVAGEECLVGSSNVTGSGLGEGTDETNIEVLVATTVHDPGVVSTLADISRFERPATRVLAEAARRLGDSLPSPASAGSAEECWFPRSRRPERAYRLYAQLPDGYLVRADKLLLHDLATSNLPPGLNEQVLQTAIRSLLSEIPLARALLNATVDTTLTRADALSHLNLLVTGEFTTNDLWVAFVNWMAHFFPEEVMKQEITEVALRRARLLP